MPRIRDALVSFVQVRSRLEAEVHTGDQLMSRVDAMATNLSQSRQSPTRAAGTPAHHMADAVHKMTAEALREYRERH